jgi:hypothetical protein
MFRRGFLVLGLLGGGVQRPPAGGHSCGRGHPPQAGRATTGGTQRQHGAAQLVDTYGAAPGSLLIDKTIAGPLAGRQGPVTIHAACNGGALSQDFGIAAGSPAGTLSQSFDGIPAGSTCTVTETVDGGTATIAATVAGNGQTVTVPAGSVVPVSFMDVYQVPTGTIQGLFQRIAASLKVTKTITGPAAHQHGPIAILVACGGPLHAFVFLIPAHTGPGSVSRVFSGLRPGARCTVTETADGHTSTVAIATSARRKTVTVRAGRTATVHLTDTFSRTTAVAPISAGLG